MCGIAGYIYLDAERKAEVAGLKRMTDCMAYRGPDGEGFYVKDRIALGHRRLSIIDPELGQQPLLSADGKKALIFNGEIYNYLELKEELKQLGQVFKTDSDTEVLMKAYEQWGHACQQKFNGMWAFALWDWDKEELFLSRDRIGEKPLHYCLYQDTFVFGSEIKTIFQFGVARQTRPELTEIYLALGNIPAPDTFYKGIFKLLPGHYAVLKGKELSEKPYWQFPQVAEENMLRDEQEVYQKFEALLKDAVKIRMRSDVPYGAFLSGGLDSSAIVCLMAKQLPQPVSTFTIGFDNAAFDESQLAEQTARTFKTEHHLGKMVPANFETTIADIFAHYDEPFGDSSAIPTGVVSGYAAQRVKMVLTGDGGDELLSGYNSYKGIKATATLRTYFPGVITVALGKLVSTGAKLSRGALRHRLNKIATVLKMSRLPFERRMAEQMSFTPINDIKQLVAGIPGIIPIESYLESLMRSCRFKDDFYKLMYVHYLHSLPNDFLVKVDRMSMAHSIEARIPFLDYRLVEFMAGVHKDVKLPGMELKSVLRKTIGKQLPAAILQAPKRGFAIPLREWFREESFHKTIHNNLQKVKGLLDEKVISKILFENQQGRRDHGNFIWSLLQLDRALFLATNYTN